MDDVTEPEKTRRIVELQALQREIQLALHQDAVGTTAEVLVDSLSRRSPDEVAGRTEGNTVVNVHVPADTSADGLARWLGRLVPVRITRGGPHSVSGEML